MVGAVEGTWSPSTRRLPTGCPAIEGNNKPPGPALAPNTYRAGIQERAIMPIGQWLIEDRSNNSLVKNNP